MASLLNETLDVDSTTINPTLLLKCDFEYLPKMESPLSVTGELRLANGKKAAQLTWNRLERQLSGRLTFPNEADRSAFREQRENHRSLMRVVLSAELSPQAIDLIERLREKDHERAARFSVSLNYSTLLSESSKTSSGAGLQIAVNIESASMNLSVGQSDWVRRFAEPLGIGKFLLMELRQLEHGEFPESWKEVFKRTQQRLSEMDAAIRQGEWYTAIDRGRQVFDNLKIFDGKPAHAPLVADFDAAMKLSNHSEDGIADLKEAIKRLFHFGSKYVHDSSRTGILNPATIATKEDAYLIYSIGLGILNLIGSKLNILAIRSAP